MVTQDAAAADPHCPETVRKAFSTLFALGKDEAGRERLREHLRLCSVPTASAGVTDVGYWIQVPTGKHCHRFGSPASLPSYCHSENFAKQLLFAHDGVRSWASQY